MASLILICSLSMACALSHAMNNFILALTYKIISVAKADKDFVSTKQSPLEHQEGCKSIKSLKVKD